MTLREQLQDADHARNNADAFLQCALDQLNTVPVMARTRADEVVSEVIRQYLCRITL